MRKPYGVNPAGTFTRISKYPRRKHDGVNSEGEKLRSDTNVKLHLTEKKLRLRCLFSNPLQRSDFTEKS